jgi:predicted transcriptional regulator
MRKATSLIAYKNILKELSERQMAVYDKIRTFPGITIKETAIKLKTTPNAISGRFTEMERSGIIKINDCKYFKNAKRKQPHSMYVLVNK